MHGTRVRVDGFQLGLDGLRLPPLTPHHWRPGRSQLSWQHNCAWFPRVTDHDRHSDGERIKRADGLLSTAVEQLDVVHREVRGLLELGRIHFVAERQRHNEQVDDILRKVTAAVLVPTLVAAAYGANTPLTLAASRASTVIMLALMVICGSATYAYLHWASRQR